jgi:hypothetical protein
LYYVSRLPREMQNWRVKWVQGWNLSQELRSWEHPGTQREVGLPLQQLLPQKSLNETLPQSRPPLYIGIDQKNENLKFLNLRFHFGSYSRSRRLRTPKNVTMEYESIRTCIEIHGIEASRFGRSCEWHDICGSYCVY